MNLTDEQWALVEPHIPIKSVPTARAAQPRHHTPYLMVSSGYFVPEHDGRTYQTVFRPIRPATGIYDGVFSAILESLAADLHRRGGLDLSECFIDGTFVPAKKGDSVLGKPSVARGPRSWPLQTAMVFLSPFTWKALHRTKSPLLKTLWQIDSWMKSLEGL